MIEIRKIYKKDIANLMVDDAFWNHSFLSISKHRLLAHSKNPNLDDDDIVLLLAYSNKELVGYMGVFIDKIIVNSIEKKIGWLSTWWVHPKTKGSGIGREILNTMYAERSGLIGISQFTPSAKRVYDKSGFFVALKENIGIKAVLRSNLSFVFPAIYQNTAKIKPLLNFLDDFLNVFINLKLYFNKKSLLNRLKKIKIEYLTSIDKETRLVIDQFNQNDISKKSDAFFEWLKAYKWVQETPLLNFSNKNDYEFSMNDNSFEIYLMKIIENKSCIGFIVLQKRNYVSKVLFTYFDNKKYSEIIANVIKLQNIIQNTREIICYETSICNNFKKSTAFLYKTKKIKQSIISADFNVIDFSNVRMNFGDGDCCFA